MPARQTHDYRRNGLTSLYAALEVATGTVVGECSARHTGDFLANGWRGVTGCKSCTSLSTILSYHCGRQGLARKASRECIFFTPTGALNMVEAWFSILASRFAAVLDSVSSLTQHIRNYINHWNHPSCGLATGRYCCQGRPPEA